MSLAQRYQPITCTTSKHLVIADDGSIRSSRFNDIYFNPASGAEETEHVFINGNQLKQRWQTLQKQSKSPVAKTVKFVIAETGFGSGLNFLVAANLWQSIWKNQSNDDNRPPVLYFYSVERFPLTPAALKKIIDCYNPFPDLAAALQEKYPDPIAGSYLLDFDFDYCQIKLGLLFGDCVDCLSRLELYPPLNNNSAHSSLAVDAWFLDGFAPAVNPDMWSEQLFTLIQQHSNSHTTLATFSAARVVKDQLQKYGFAYSKLAGFAKKREMISAKYSGTQVKSHAAEPTSPCYHRPVFSTLTRPSCTIIGSGIAGSCIAYLLARSGWQVNVLEADKDIAHGASGNSTGILYARSARERSALADFHEAAFNYAVSFYRNLKDTELTDGLCGMIKLHERISDNLLSHNGELALRKTIDQSSASILSGLEVSGGGIFYSNAGVIQPRKICMQLLQHKNITLYTNKRITHIEQQAGKWLLSTNGQPYIETNNVVIACGQYSNAFSQTKWLPIKALRGQTTELKSDNALYNQLKRTKISICHKGYLTPAVAGQISIGASFTLHNESPEISAQDHSDNLQKLAQALAPHASAQQPILQLQKNSKALGRLTGRTAFRAVMPDYLPVAGAVVQQHVFLRQFAALRLNAKKTPQQFASLHDGLYVLAGFGSHGFTTAPLAAELLAAQISGQPIPFSDTLRQAIAPQRFLIRQIIRGKA